MRCYVRCFTAIHKWFQQIQKYDDNEKSIFFRQWRVGKVQFFDNF